MATKKTQGTDGLSNIAKMEADLYVLSMKHAAGELKQTHELKKLRKEIARAKTQNSLANI